MRHVGGVDRVPARPERIAAFGIAVDDLATLGLRPAMVGMRWHGDVADYVADHVQGAVRIGTNGYLTGVNVEQLLFEAPDLILVGNPLQYRLLRRVAPTVVHARQWADVSPVEPRLRALGAALGIAEHAEECIREHRARADRDRAVLRSRLGDRSICLLHVHGHDVRVFGLEVLARIAEQTGLRPDPAVEEHFGPGGGFVAPELLGNLRADVLVAGVDDDSIGAERTFREIVSSPLMQRVPAVRRGHVLRVEVFPWVFRSALATEQVLRDLLRAFPAPLPRAIDEETGR